MYNGVNGCFGKTAVPVALCPLHRCFGISSFVSPSTHIFVWKSKWTFTKIFGSSEARSRKPISFSWDFTLTLWNFFSDNFNLKKCLKWSKKWRLNHIFWCHHNWIFLLAHWTTFFHCLYKTFSFVLNHVFQRATVMFVTLWCRWLTVGDNSRIWATESRSWWHFLDVFARRLC